ncbi:MAG: type 1 glutamine amidotransferase [Chloroflexi bacterium]|nr:type 1 glutamine amidotransferase [Chloroflexota bacterium]
MKRVLVLQHAEPERLGLIAEALAEAGALFHVCRPFAGQTIPASLDGYDGLIVLGGPPSVYQEDRFPYLAAEVALIRRVLEAGLPLLGVCLGSQIMAEALGARVRPSGRMELGWHEVRLAQNALEDPLFQGLPANLTAFHWHGDVYDLPPGTKPIGSSALTPVQGFIAGPKAYGLLFHLEVTGAQVRAMVEAFPQDVSAAGVDAAALLVETAARADALRPHGQRVFGAWAKLL